MALHNYIYYKHQDEVANKIARPHDPRPKLMNSSCMPASANLSNSLSDNSTDESSEIPNEESLFNAKPTGKSNSEDSINDGEVEDLHQFYALSTSESNLICNDCDKQDINHIDTDLEINIEMFKELNLNSNKFSHDKVDGSNNIDHPHHSDHRHDQSTVHTRDGSSHHDHHSHDNHHQSHHNEEDDMRTEIVDINCSNCGMYLTEKKHHYSNISPAKSSKKVLVDGKQRRLKSRFDRLKKSNRQKMEV
ncbi:unnamed protein product [[Candida] boidinii]|uniref:Unnamed protein product n=1 Tax=Candida boidinii TaxID=5477 RepID=A0A9W6T1N9_CANBO|nr:hypothetical protein BVG19_g530 [[Candida] boidinii]OWB48497.1 hypothetical protein B5S27_g32 [[Candida] boidinii]OWB65730.1 hypothetical protein B5S30_g1060 [[Candida] boidinii]OWB82367.1 hypothetical protein B5S33_g992 [[Candida] boidinii]GME69422.1 unnamed protein product [[Candida] boidinii]